MKKIIPVGRHGFSLIELIVVITIIAIMTTIAVVSFSGTNKRARDSKRVADLEKYRIALEMARQIGVTYPANLNILPTMGLIGTTISDPKTGYSYAYNRLTDYSYELYACVEDVGASNSPCSGATCNCAGGNCLGGYGCNYRVVNP